MWITLPHACGVKESPLSGQSKYSRSFSALELLHGLPTREGAAVWKTTTMLPRCWASANAKATLNFHTSQRKVADGHSARWEER